MASKLDQCRLMRAALYLLRMAAVAQIGFLIGCAANSGGDVLRRQSETIDPALIALVLQRAPVAEDRDFRAETLVVSREFSAHLLQFRTREQRHIHRRHDLTFVVHRGDGEVYVNDRRFVVHAGDVFHIPRGTPHYCVNRGDQALVAVIVFTPPYDMKDSIPVPQDARSHPREGEDTAPPTKE